MEVLPHPISSGFYPNEAGYRHGAGGRRSEAAANFNTHLCASREPINFEG